MAIEDRFPRTNPRLNPRKVFEKRVKIVFENWYVVRLQVNLSACFCEAFNFSAAVEEFDLRVLRITRSR